jgi:hypothetical protein
VTGLPKDGIGERRNASDYLLNDVTWCVRSGALHVGLMKTDNYENDLSDSFKRLTFLQ